MVECELAKDEMELIARKQAEEDGGGGVKKERTGGEKGVASSVKEEDEIRGRGGEETEGERAS